MSELLSTLHGVLQEAGFTAWITSQDHSSVVCFEDDVLMGFACVFSDPQSLLEQWASTEMLLLRRFSPNLRAAGEKAWNVYCVFLCRAAADSVQSRQVSWIEEDLERTRKIAACGLITRADLTRALLPILPIQYQPALRVEDVTQRLQARIKLILPNAPEVVLNENVAPEVAIRLLSEDK